MRSALVVAILLAALPAAPAVPAPLTVCLDADLAPWSWIPERLPDLAADPADTPSPPPVTQARLATLTGIDVDVARALARRLGEELEPVHTRWYDIETALAAGRCEAVVNAWTPTRRTPAGILASDAYLDWGLLIAARSGDARLRSFADVAGKRVGHIPDPAAERTLGSLQASLVSFDTNRAAFYALASGQVDALALDSTYVRWRIGRGEAFRAVGEPLNRLTYHVAVREDGPRSDDLLATVRDLIASPEMAAIRQRWSEGAGARP